MKALVTLRKALSDPELLGSVLEGESWSNWRTLLIAANGEPLTMTSAASSRNTLAAPHRPASASPR